MKGKKREMRFFALGQPRLRESTDSNSRTIEGYAIVFGVLSNMICDWEGLYREVIEPGAITEEDLKRMDIKMTMWHNREKLLARSNKGVGTLWMSVDSTGVKYSFDAPMTSDGDNALELVKRGDLAGSSFIYWCDEDHSVNYTREGDGLLTRHVNKIDEIYDFTIASDPAYAETTVTRREIDEKLAAAEGKARECGDGKKSDECGKKKAEDGEEDDDDEECDGEEGCREIDEFLEEINN